MKSGIYKGDKLKEMLPGNIVEDLEISFKDHGLVLEDDLQHCEMHVLPKGTCWIHDTRNKTDFWKGTLIATFNIDGGGFYFTGNSRRNDKRFNDYQNKRIAFFKTPRTARELDEFEKEHHPIFPKG